jgi:hypothetical protein
MTLFSNRFYHFMLCLLFPVVATSWESFAMEFDVKTVFALVESHNLS